ncbi:WG repeat-containing protein [Flavicella marina]|uniref:WG repeat-containing protein n=1 Tax=Flavicella marina TaxID=1475951 RepID=UPI001264A255|nr:WG repeat-containing protein [Flavicella marina]
MKTIINLFIILSLFSCKKRFKPVTYENEYFELTELNSKDTLFRISKSEFYEMGDDFAFINRKGDTIISSDDIYYSFQDTIITFGIVIKKEPQSLIGINRKGETLFEVYPYDNGPDEFHDGLLRIMKNGKIGFANEKGEIIIKPQFECASIFENAIATVSNDCYLYYDQDGHLRSESESWFKIDKTGKRIK